MASSAQRYRAPREDSLEVFPVDDLFRRLSASPLGQKCAWYNCGHEFSLCAFEFIGRAIGL